MAMLMVVSNFVSLKLTCCTFITPDENKFQTIKYSSASANKRFPQLLCKKKYIVENTHQNLVYLIIKVVHIVFFYFLL